MWPYSWTHVGTPSHLGHMDRVAATMPSQAHAGAAQEAPNMGQWEGQDVPLVRPSSCIVKGCIPSSRRYLPTYLPALALHRIMHLRLLRSQDHPPGYRGVTCPFCHRPYLDSAAHLQYHCPPYYALQLLLAWHLFTHPPILSATAKHSPHLISPFELRTATAAVYLTDHLPASPQPGPPKQLGFSMLGMWHSTSPQGAPPPLLDSAGREGLLRELLSTLSTTHTSLASLLRRAPSHNTAPPAPLPPHVPTPPCTQPLTLRHSIALVWLLRHCATWRLTVDCQPVVPLPPAPLPGQHPAHVVFTPASRAADILPHLGATPRGQRILLAANPSNKKSLPCLSWRS